MIPEGLLVLHRHHLLLLFSGFVSIPCFISVIPFLNECTPVPMPFISSGIFLPPKNSNTTSATSSTSYMLVPPINKGVIIIKGFIVFSIL